MKFSEFSRNWKTLEYSSLAPLRTTRTKTGMTSECLWSAEHPSHTDHNRHLDRQIIPYLVPDLCWDSSQLDRRLGRHPAYLDSLPLQLQLLDKWSVALIRTTILQALDTRKPHQVQYKNISIIVSTYCIAGQFNATQFVDESSVKSLDLGDLLEIEVCLVVEG